MITINHHPEKGTRPKVQIKTDVGDSKASWLSIEQDNMELAFMYANADEQKACLQTLLSALLLHQASGLSNVQP